MLPIQRKITPYNRTVMSNKVNNFIVIHYVGSQSSAASNAKYFYNNKLKSSASYFVDETSIWQCVEDKNAAWHCGGKMQAAGIAPFYQKCTNSNSIGIEMCCKKDASGEWYIEPATVNNTIDLTKMLMAKYNIGADRVIRHYDVVYKDCPRPFVQHPEQWESFKAKLGNTAIEEKIVNYRARITASTLNCRAGYSTAYSILMTYKLNDIVTISKEANGWGYTENGWISLNYIEVLKEEEKEVVTQEQFNEMMNVWIANSANAQPGAWSQEARNWATIKGLVKGDKQGRQMWKKNMTREEFVSVLARLFNVSDSAVADWSETARTWAQNKGIVSGNGEDYGWMDYVTKEQLITILYRLLGAKNEK